ncbi:MAG: TrmH family RNA methyltransferase [Treponema sp.]|jgi:TrmH family RNA methyltransferase|nr:TrmH family RNA methyltransferase [Treponema sp.]
MTPLSALEKLPPSQRLRKLLRIFSEAEYRISRSAAAPVETGWDYFSQAAALALRDSRFSGAARETLERSAETLALDPLRSLNSIRHILLAELGKAPADWDFIDHQGLLNSGNRRIFPGTALFLEDVRAPYNVGAIFRTAESFGIERIYLSPLCASPLHPRASRSAMGCVSLIPWEHRTLESLKGPCFALETGGTALPDFAFPSRGLLVLGSEELGVSPGALARSDSSKGRVSIPLWGAKGSLNVSAAFGILMYAWARFLVNSGTRPVSPTINNLRGDRGAFRPPGGGVTGAEPPLRG